jgi:phage terminase large subunit GpA-like protein
MISRPAPSSWLSGTADASALARAMAANVFAPREELTVSQWAERHRMLDSKFSDRGGRWSSDMTPYLVGPMDAYNASETREITFMKPAQIGGTEWLINTLAYVIDHRPVTAMFVYPTEDSARETNADRLIPALQRSPAVARHFSERKHDVKVMALILDRMNLYFRGSNSEVGLDRVPAGLVIIDELDRCNAKIDVVTALRARLTTYETTSKFLRTGTPSDEGVGIHKDFHEADDRRTWYVPCPHCLTYHTRYGRFTQCVRWPHPGQDTAKKWEVDRQTLRDQAWFECPHCHGKCESKHTRWQGLHGVWLSEGETVEVGREENAEAQRDQTRGTQRGACGKGKGERQEDSPQESPQRLSLSSSAPLCDSAFSSSVTPLYAMSFDALRGRGTEEESATLASAFGGRGVRIVNPRARPGRHVAFRMSGLDSLLVTNPYGFVAEEFVTSKGNPNREWITRKLGEAWAVRGDRVEPHELRKFARPVSEGGYARRVVPMGAVALTMAGDLQRDRVVWSVRAWGPGMRDTWLVDAGETPAPVGNELVEFLELPRVAYPMQHGDRFMRPLGVTLDSGDGKRAPEVYGWAIKMRSMGVRAWPCKGVESQQMDREVSEVRLAESKLTQYKTAGLTLLRVNSQHMSAQLAARMRGHALNLGTESSDEETGINARMIWGLYEGVTDEYLAQVTAIQLKPPPKSNPRLGFRYAHKPGFDDRDHWHDAERYNIALAVHMGLRMVHLPVELLDRDGVVVGGLVAGENGKGQMAKGRGEPKGAGGGGGGGGGGPRVVGGLVPAGRAGLVPKGRGS